MRALERPSPNHDERPAGRRIDLLVLHYTGMPDGESALARLTDPAAKVSAHYLVEEEGRLWRLVPEERRAWHAGLASWAGERDVNGCSLGIELVNPGHEFGYRPFPEAQMETLLALLSDLRARHAILPSRVLGHSDVAPLRKEDPGELFDWRRLAAAGHGLWPEAPAEAAAPAASLPELLSRLGYGFCEDDPAAVIRAFQRHFRPAALTGTPDRETAALARALLTQTGGRPL